MMWINFSYSRRRFRSPKKKKKKKKLFLYVVVIYSISKSIQKGFLFKMCSCTSRTHFMCAVILFSTQLNKITILSVSQKTKEALFAGFFRFIAFLE